MNAKNNGFTIIEMIIVVVMIAILATLTVFGFNNWRTRTAKSEMKNELKQAYSAVKLYRVNNNTYPTTSSAFATVYTPTNTVVLTYNTSDSGASQFCIKATSQNDASNTPMYIGSSVSEPTTTALAGCP